MGSSTMDQDLDHDALSDLMSLFYSHSIPLKNLVLSLTWNWTTILLLVMRPETFLLLTGLLIAFCVTHTFDLWSQVLAQRLSRSSWLNFMGPLTKGGSRSGRTINGEDPLTAGFDDTYEMKTPKVGVFSLRGRRPKMEDTFDYIDSGDTLGVDLYGVYDGHGSDKTAIYAKKHLLTNIHKRIQDLVSSTVADQSDSDGCKTPSPPPSPTTLTCPKHRKDNKENDQTCSNHPLTCFKEKTGSNSGFTHFLEMNKRLEKDIKRIITEETLSLDDQVLVDTKRTLDYGGSTALFAIRLHSLNRLLVANVGDSRGVLCNSRGMVVPLSFDHKPQSEKEHKRIREAGGFIKFSGVWRVAGVLATSRALGDYPLKDKKFITAEPDILTFELKDHQPQFVILASDGLWDVMSNADAVNFVVSYLATLRKKGVPQSDLAFEASKALCIESYKRLSVDNITVLVVLFDPKEFTTSSSQFGVYTKRASIKR